MKRVHRLPVLSPDDPVLDRRRALLLGGALLASACGSPGGQPDVAPEAGCQPPPPFDGGPTGCPGRDVGAVADFAVGTRTVLMAQRAFLLRDACGLYCLSMTCSHFGGMLELVADGRIHCTLMPAADHGSYFDSNGVALTGPATTVARPNLENYLVTICGDRVFVSTTRTVPLGTRTPVA